MRYCLGVLLACATSVGAAHAADFGGPPAYDGSIKDGPVLAQQSWSGLYFGGHAGWATGEWDGNLTHIDGKGVQHDTIWGNTTSRSIDADGWFGGGQIGWNRQHGSFLWGLEADVSGGDFSGGGIFTTVKDVEWAIDTKVDVFGTVRARLGFLPTARLLLYGTGGFAWARTNADLVVSQPHVTAVGDASENHFGWTAGAGGEYMLTNNWTIRGEWLHVDLGDAGYHLKGTAYAGTPNEKVHTTDSFPADLTFDVFRLGVNYKFGN